MRYTFFLFLLFLLACKEQATNEYTAVKLDTLKTCDTDFTKAIDFINQHQFRINVTNLYHHNIYRYGAGKRIGHYEGYPPRPVGFRKIWVPFNGYRATLGGTLTKYYVSTTHDNETPDQDEYDWNLDITPATAFAPYLGAGWIEGEVTPPSSLRQNDWFPQKGSGLPSLLLNKTLCIYGPWVKDVGNDDNKEIHPAEAIWFNNPKVPGEVVVLLMQDASSFRFTENADYDFDEDGDGVNDFHAGWKPWVTIPQEEKISIPFSYSPADGTYTIINVAEGRADMVTTILYPQLGDSDKGEIHQLKTTSGNNTAEIYNSTILVQVNEQKTSDPNLGIQFGNLCKSTDGKIHGYVHILTALGRAGTNDRGFQVLRFSFSSGKNPDRSVTK